jgi:DUF4097 and DUF4098 domain-containing protein YvlB
MSNGTPRRRSIFSGLLLILIGSLLLLARLVPQFELWELFYRYWPALLILWGLAKLFDFFASRRMAQAAPPALTGGEVLLLVLLLCLAGTIGGINWLREHGQEIDISLGPFDRRFSFTEELAKPAKPSSHITITTDRGNISIHPEEDAEIRVLAKKTIAALNETEAQKRARRVAIVIRELDDGYQVLPEVQEKARATLTLDLEIHVPKQAAVTARTIHGDIRISGVAGSVSAASRSGDIEIRQVGGDVETEMHSGDLRVLGAGGNVKLAGRGREIEMADIAGEASIQADFRGPIRIKNVAKGTRFLSRRTDLTVTQLPGRLELGSGSLALYDTPGSVSLATRDKDITMENVRGRLHIENRHGNVEVRFSQPPREEVEISNDSGSVELALPPKSSFELHASCRSGDVESDFRDPGLKASQEEQISKLEGRLGTRGPRLQLRTSYGTIRLRKAT